LDVEPTLGNWDVFLNVEIETGAARSSPASLSQVSTNPIVRPSAIPKRAFIIRHL
jgi:hypothetical protein